MPHHDRLTRNAIDRLAQEIISLCIRDGYGDVGVFWNGKRARIDYEGSTKTENGVNPFDYFEYAAEKHILSMTFEGRLYESINYGDGCPKLSEILDKYGLYYELGNEWNLTAFPSSMDIEDVEYTEYKREKPKKPVYIGMNNAKDKTLDGRLAAIMEDWYEKSRETGDTGGCVIGAGFTFDYNGTYYKMAPCSPWQGECSWLPHVDDIKKQLKNIGCENIEWNPGILD